MPALTKRKLEDILTATLQLHNPRFRLERIGTRLVGSIISQTFHRKQGLERQRMIRKALESELGEQAHRAVGMLLAYTPDEWDIDLEFDLMQAEKPRSGRNGASTRRSARARRSGRARLAKART